MFVHHNVYKNMKLFACFSEQKELSCRSWWARCWSLRRPRSPPHHHSHPLEPLPNIGRQSSFESIRDVTSTKRPKIFPESHPQHRSQSHHHEDVQNMHSLYSYRSTSFPPNLNVPDENSFVILPPGKIYPMNGDQNNKKNHGSKMDMDSFLQEFNQDMEFIENMTRGIMKAKRAIDDEIYQEMQRRPWKR